MLRHVDAVHGAYYLLMWPLRTCSGPVSSSCGCRRRSRWRRRSSGTAVIGRRLGSLQTGLLAGLVFAALPMTSRFGQEARSYALVTAVAVIASYLLVRAIDEPGSRLSVGYGLSLVALGFLNMFGLLIIPAHAMTLAAAAAQAPIAGAGQSRQPARASISRPASGRRQYWASGLRGWRGDRQHGWAAAIGASGQPA